MNKDQIKGGMKNAAGKIQEGAGRMTGDRNQEAKGNLKQAGGTVQKNYGDAKQDVKDVLKK